MGFPFETHHASYRGPVLCITGDKSEYFENADQIILREFFPRASIVTIKGASHWVHADRPEIFFLSVLNFLTGLINRSKKRAAVGSLFGLRPNIYEPPPNTIFLTLQSLLRRPFNGFFDDRLNLLTSRWHQAQFLSSTLPRTFYQRSSYCMRYERLRQYPCHTWGKSEPTSNRTSRPQKATSAFCD